MARLALLVRESANRVYDHDAPRLLASELAVVVPEANSITSERIAGVDYVTFDSVGPDADEQFLLSNLSAAQAVFRLDDDERLAPIEVTRMAAFDSDLITTQRYPGKTNEQFTHLLVNVAVAASSAAQERVGEGKRVRVLDPIAGRGSTLNRALVYGYDGSGIEIADADVDQYRTFLTGYMKEHRIKHRVTREKVRKGPLSGTWRFGVTIAGQQQVTMVRGDTAEAADLLAGQSFDVIIGDLPYGVQHRAASAANRLSPGELVARAAPGWRTLLRRGGSIGLSWNLKSLPRDELVECLDHAGFDAVEHPASFEHVVDRTITRDVIVATARRGG